MIDLRSLDADAQRQLELYIAQLPTQLSKDIARQMLFEIYQHGEPISAQYLKPSMPFHNFVKEAWPLIDPAPFVDSWHIGAVCEHLEAVAFGQINNLIINVPPRSSKSMLKSVMFPAWMWTFAPWKKFLCGSWSSLLATEHSRLCRELIQTDWYRERYGHMFQLMSDANLKTRFDNTKLGFRMATSVNSSAIGQGGDILTVDDPNDPRNSESGTSRKVVNDWWDKMMRQRLNNKITGARIITQQRLHQQDLTGHVLAMEPENWVRLIIPMEFDTKHRATTYIRKGKVFSLAPERDDAPPPPKPEDAEIFWQDPRTEANELMCPERMPRDVVETEKIPLGSYGTAGQFQQRPAPAGGGMFKRAWFQIVAAVPRKVERRVRFWDAAGTTAEENPDAAYTVGLRMSKANGIYYVEHITRGQWSSFEVNQTMKNTADIDGKDVRQKEEQEPGSSGKSVVRSHLALLAGYDYIFETASGDKVVRARPFAAQAEAGNVKLLAGPWNEAYLDELENFGPGSGLKDQVDASSGALNEIEFGTNWSDDGGIH